MRRTPSILAGLVLLSALAACSSKASKINAPNPFEIDASEYPRVFQATEEVLREEGFALERHDYRFGHIDTKPLPAATVMEPWRPTNTTLYQAVTATLNYQRRIATVTIEPAAEAAAEEPAAPTTQAATQPATHPQVYQIRVEVQLQQEEVPTRQLSGATRGPRIQGHLREVPTELRDRGITSPYWRPVGRDPYLEQRLLAAIIRRSTRIP